MRLVVHVQLWLRENRSQRSPMIHATRKLQWRIYASGSNIQTIRINSQKIYIRKGSKCACDHCYLNRSGLVFRSWIFSSKLWVWQAFLQDGKSVTIRFKWCWLVCRQTVSFTFSHFPAKWQVQLGGSSSATNLCLEPTTKLNGCEHKCINIIKISSKTHQISHGPTRFPRYLYQIFSTTSRFQPGGSSTRPPRPILQQIRRPREVKVKRKLNPPSPMHLWRLRRLAFRGGPEMVDSVVWWNWVVNLKKIFHGFLRTKPENFHRIFQKMMENYLGGIFGESRWHYRMDGISSWLPQLVAPKGLWHLGIMLCWTCFWCARLFQIQCQRVIPEGKYHFGGSIFGVVDRSRATLVPWITRARSSGFWVWCVLVSWNINSCCWRSKILCWRRLRRAGVLYWEIKLLETLVVQ